MKTYNRGEWSEPYLLLKLIVERKLYLGKENFEKIENVFYKILKIIHFEKTENTLRIANFSCRRCRKGLLLFSTAY